MHTDEAMPTQPDINAAFCALLAEHRISQTDLADAMGIARSAVAKMANGTQAVSVEALRVLWGRTQDPRVINLIGGERDWLVIDLTAQPGTDRPDVDLATCLVALSGLQNQALRPDALSSGRESRRTRAAIDTAVRHLLFLRRRVAAGEPVPFRFRQARALATTLTA